MTPASLATNKATAVSRKLLGTLSCGTPAYVTFTNRFV